MYLVIPCAASLADHPTSKAYGLSGLVHEKAHLVVPDTNLDLNALMLGASTVRWSSKFNLLITLFEKKYLVISLEHRVLTSLHQ